MELILKLLLGAGESIFWGIVFLFVAFIILPASIIDYILKRLRPDWVSKPKIISRVKLILDYILNHKDVVVSSGGEEKQKERENEINSLIQEKRRLENNLFFLDMLKSLSSMLYFSVSRSGYDENAVIEIIEQAMEYLMYYGNQLQDTEGALNQRERIYRAASDLNNQLDSLVNFKRSKTDDNTMLLIAKHALQQGLQGFDSFMKNEYESTRSQLTKINQVLAQRLMDFVEA